MLSKSLLDIIYRSVSLRAKTMNYKGIPKSLNSLTLNNPSNEELNNDYILLSKHFKHPVFSSFIPTYNEMIEDEINAWIKRYNLSIKDKFFYK